MAKATSWSGPRAAATNTRCGTSTWDHPEVHLQVGAAKLVAKARTAVGEERFRLWGLMAVIWPEYERYQKRTSREIPVVVLEPQ